MGSVRQIALAILGLSCIVFIALFGRIPAFRSTPIAALHRLLLHRLPTFIRNVDKQLTGGRLTSSASRLGHHLFQEAHNVVLIAYLSLLTGAASVFLYTAWSLIPPWPHHILIPFVVTAPYVFTYLCATSTASQIDGKNLDANLHIYRYDNILYHPRMNCSTCRFEKPARSKHCSLCNSCIARHDHHCVWVNNCIGLGNYKWFMALLVSLGTMLTYGAYLAWNILSTSRAWSKAGRGWFEKLGIAIAMNINVGAVGLLATFTAPLAWGLFAYHVYLIWAGMTTNETAKWNGLKADIDDGNAWMGTRRLEGHNSSSSSTTPADRDEACIVIVTDGRPPSSLRLDKLNVASWNKLESLDDVVNIYDRGFWPNFKDAFAFGH